MFPFDTFSIKPFGIAKLTINISVTQGELITIKLEIQSEDLHNTTSAAIPLLQHQVKSQFPCESDQAIVSGFRDDKNILDIRADASTTC